jgi:hypothetical protein
LIEVLTCTDINKCKLILPYHDIYIIIWCRSLNVDSNNSCFISSSSFKTILELFLAGLNNSFDVNKHDIYVLVNFHDIIFAPSGREA